MGDCVAPARRGLPSRRNTYLLTPGSPQREGVDNCVPPIWAPFGTIPFEAMQTRRGRLSAAQRGSWIRERKGAVNVKHFRHCVVQPKGGGSLVATREPPAHGLHGARGSETSHPQRAPQVGHVARCAGGAVNRKGRAQKVVNRKGPNKRGRQRQSSRTRC